MEEWECLRNNRLQITPFPWISPFFKYSLKFYQNSYGRLPHFGIQIILSDNGITPLMFEPKVTSGTIPVLIFLCVQSILSIYSLVSMISNFSTSENRHLDILRIVMQIFISVWTLIVSILTRINFLRDGKLFCSCANYFFSANTNKRQLSKKHFDFVGLVLLYISVVAVIVVIPLPFVLRFMKLDVWHIIFQELGLFTNDSGFMWTLSLTFTSISYLLFAVRDYVAIMTLDISLVLSVEGFISAIRVMSETNYRNLCILKAYVTTRMMFNRIAELYSTQTLFFVVFSLIMDSLFLWIIVNCFHIIHILMVEIFAVGLFGGLGVTVLLLNKHAQLRSHSVALKSDSLKQFQRSRFAYLRRQWLAQQPLPINCGQHFAFSKEATMNFLNVQVDLAVNLLLLVDV